mmetsp:Transcript_28549/g.60528  ORF Transcript_28549/g.60528 Transcript_28549/m.60528 type:complete len:328 (-) Transcript_28549:1525-2508(-)
MPHPKASRESLRASHASYILAPSPGSLAAYIQLPLALMSSTFEIFAHMRLVMASATLILAMAAESTSPLMGCSPHATAVPVLPKCVWAVIPTFARGSWSGPTHCCWATRPVTDRSTLWTRKRFDPTERRRRTRSTTSRTVVPSGSLRGWSLLLSTCESVKVFCGIFPRTSSSGRSTGVEPSAESLTTTLPSPVTAPRMRKGQFSRSAIFRNSASESGRMRSALFSWYSAPQISRTERVLSPTYTFLISYSAPAGSTISFSTLPLPPAPWSCTLTIGFSSPKSQHALISRFILFSISASPLCTASKSSAAFSLDWTLLEAAPPPMPMR